MKLTPYLNELINSGITLNEKETALVEEYLFSISKPVKKQHLAHYQSIAAINGRGGHSA